MGKDKQKTRHLESKIKQLLEMFPVVAVIGPRQCGKSTIVKMIKPEWAYYDLESPDDYHLISNDPVSFFQLKNSQVIIDEAQQYPEIFKVLRGVIDADRKQKGRFIITGSSSPEIIKGLTESLAGRIAIVEMWPFKVRECYEKPLSEVVNRIIRGITSPKECLDISSDLKLKQYLDIWYSGAFPEPLLEKDQLFQKQWMENFISNYVSKDIRGLFPKINIHNYRRFLVLLAQFSGHQLNMSEMARSLDVSTTTIKDYLDIIHQTFLWRNLDVFEKNKLKKIQKARKGFFRDQGMLHYYLKIQSLDDLLIHPAAGFSYESFVIEEIIRSFGSTMGTQIEFSYYRTIDKSEIDLVVEGPFGIVPIEIKLGSSIKSKSLKGLMGFISDMKLNYGIIINNAKKIEMLNEKIIQIPINYF